MEKPRQDWLVGLKMTTEEIGLVQAVKDEPQDPVPRLVSADWMKEEDRPCLPTAPRWAELQRRTELSQATKADGKQSNNNRREKKLQRAMKGTAFAFANQGQDLYWSYWEGDDHSEHVH